MDYSTEQEFRNIPELSGAGEKVGAQLWVEITKHYNQRGRIYHNLDHLDYLLRELQGVKGQVNDWSTVVFALVYHDIIYSVRRQDNEEKSAEFARASLRKISFPEERISRCVRHILATKSHSVTDDADANLFTDADIAILGSRPELYKAYARKIRKEYWIYPAFVYKPGRINVLRHFLGMDYIFKTAYFREKYEANARINLEVELKQLSG